MTGAAEQLAPVLRAGGPELRDLLDRTEERLGELATGHGETLAGHASGTLSAGGKRLRPLLVFLCGNSGVAGDARRARGAGLGPDRSDFIPALVSAAAAVELLHMATLVHDDVLDRAELRRGRPTVFATDGRDAATATGDLLFSRAFAELVSTGSDEAVRSLSAASSALARGELMQRADAWSGSVSRERYLERCELKTASLFDAASRLGALLGKGLAGAAAALGEFGRRLGLAFQILDDVLDVSGPTERTGKPRGADLLDGTVTLPLIVARSRDPDLARLDLRSVGADPLQVGELCDRITRTGALDEARQEALGYVADAKRILDDLDLQEQRRYALELVADGVVERYA